MIRKNIWQVFGFACPKIWPNSSCYLVFSCDKYLEGLQPVADGIGFSFSIDRDVEQMLLVRWYCIFYLTEART